MKKLLLALLLLASPAWADDLPLFSVTPPFGDNSTRIATTQWVQENGGGGGGSGTVTTVICGTGLSGGTFHVSGTCAVIYGTTSNTAVQGNDSRVTGALQASNNLSDVANTATALTNIGGVPVTRAVNTGSGLTGGGALSADRTIALSSISTGNLLGNVSGISAAPSAVTPSQALDIIGSTQGQILYRDSGGWQVLNPGTVGQVLQSGGAGSNPSWLSLSNGTVTSITLAGGTGISITGTNPVTTSGTITVSPSGVLADIAGGSYSQGDILYYNGTNMVRLPAGTSGNVLTTQGAGANPSWVAAPSGNVPVGGSTGQVLAKASGTNYDTTWTTISGTGNVIGPGSSTDNAIVRFDGTAGTGIQNSGVIIDDSNNITGIVSLITNNGGLKAKDTGGSNSLAFVPGSSLTAARTLTFVTGDASRTLTLSGDATISGTNTGDQTITLTGNVTGSGTGSFATTIANGVVTGAMMAAGPLSYLGALVPASDRLPYFDSSSSAALATFTSAGRNLVGGADASAQRTTLGLGTAATVNTGTSGATIPLLNGNNTYSGITTYTGSIVTPIRVFTTSGNVTVSASTDYFICVKKGTGAATAVNLPSSPATGLTFLVKDCKGDAATNNITVTPASGNIDGAATYVINTNYASVAVTYDGTQWEIN